MGYADYFTFMTNLARGDVQLGGVDVGQEVNSSDSDSRKYTQSRSNIKELLRMELSDEDAFVSTDKSMLYNQQKYDVIDGDYENNDAKFFSEYTVTKGTTLWDAAEAETMKNIVRLSNENDDYDVYYKDGTFVTVEEGTETGDDGILIESVDNFDTIDLDQTKNFQRMVIDVVAEGTANNIHKQWEGGEVHDLTNILGSDVVSEAIAVELSDLA